MNDQENKLILFSDKEGRATVTIPYSNGEDMWLSREQIANMFATTPQNISYHIRNIYATGELSEENTRKKQNALVCPESIIGTNRSVNHYNLDMIIAIGFRVRSMRGTQFRRWAIHHLSEYLIKGFTIDSERLKNPNGQSVYFDELLARIRDIRASEKRFFQQFRELFSLCSDYYPDVSAQKCFETIQDKLFYAVTGQTAAEIISSRANANKPNMGLTAWKGSRVRYCDIVIARNYLQEDETDTFNRLVSIFLDHAELRAKDHQDLTMDFWNNCVDRILKLLDMNIFQGKASITTQESKKIAIEQYELFDDQRKKLEAAQADADDLKLLEEIEKKKTSRITART